MQADLFYWILNMSISGTVVGSVVLLIRQIRRMKRSVIDLLWVIPFIRLWIPFGAGSPYSLMSLIHHFIKGIVIIPREGQSSNIVYMNFVGAADGYFPITYKTDTLERIFQIGFVVWILFEVLFLLMTAVFYDRTKSELRDAAPLKENVSISDKLLSPAVFGILHPKIVLPQYIVPDHMEYVLMHERVHIRRLDNLRRLAMLVTCCIHWFNPFVWVFAKCFFEDLELSCDERVLRMCGEEGKDAYAKALIACEAEKRMFASTFGGADIRMRIEKILSYKKLTAFSAICFVILIVAAVATLLTNAGI